MYKRNIAKRIQVYSVVKSERSNYRKHVIIEISKIKKQTTTTALNGEDVLMLLPTASGKSRICQVLLLTDQEQNSWLEIHSHQPL